MDPRFNLISQNVEELISESSLTALLASNTPLKHYIGFEISGQVHIGTGFMTGLKVRDLQAAGVECTIWLADLHSWINDKLGGDRKVIEEMARGYFQEAMVASIAACGGDPSKVKFLLASEVYEKSVTFWPTVIEIAKNTTLNRAQRSISIMGRDEKDAVDLAKLFYPPMQAADIFELGTNIVQAGTDQRKAHVLALDSADSLKINPLMNSQGQRIKPVFIHHHLLLGLGKPTTWPLPPDASKQDILAAFKMSKSKADSALFVTDEVDVIKQKISKAFCPEGEVEFNPVLDWAKYLVFALGRGPLRIEREVKHGGDLTFNSFDELVSCFRDKQLHPMDLKSAMIKSISDLLAPVREHFSKEPHRSALQKMIEITAALKK